MDQEQPESGFEEQEPRPREVPKTSPIRPENPSQPQPKITPSLMHPSQRDATSTQSDLPATSELDLPPEEKAQQAIEQLSQKMSQVVQEFSDGKINQAQFNAIYTRYSEQKQITERLLQRDPQSQAWQSVIRPGHTGFLRSHFEAKIVSYGIYALTTGQQITLQGNVRLPQSQLTPVFARLNRIVSQGHRLGAAWRQLKDQNWVMIVPGKYTVSVVIFSLEPAVFQRKQVEDAHRDFERANDKLLQRGDYDVNSLVFPHRALLH